MLNILADENIPLVQEAFGSIGKVTLLPGQAIHSEAVRGVDVLLVRSVTRVDERLLAGSHVQMVGSATIGTDHVDRNYLKHQGISFAHAPGSNATSVVEYVLAALYWLSVRQKVSMRGKTLGIVGCGAIGGRLAPRAAALGLRILKNDPPLAVQAESENRAHDFVPLSTILQEADIITLHVPFTLDGPYPTQHLFDREVLQAMKPGAWLINTARGAVVSGEALESVLEANHLGTAVLDVWEKEPTPDPDLIRRIAIATPHIAGYSWDGKVEGTRMLYEAITRHFQEAASWDRVATARTSTEPLLHITPPENVGDEPAWCHAVVRQMYDLAADDARFRVLLDQPTDQQAAFFNQLRKHYPRRRTFFRYILSAASLPLNLEQILTQGLGIQLGEGQKQGGAYPSDR